ncbi:MAG: hypothetical protein ACLFQV_06710 [Vulcanimicrobiota bacterium]
MKKIAIILLLLFIINCPVSPVSAQNKVPRVYVNGVKQDLEPLSRKGLFYLPANAMAMALGITIKWDPQARILKINNNVVATRILMEDGILYLPVDSICNNVNACVEWNGDAHVLNIQTRKQGALVKTAPTPASTKPPAEKKPGLSPPEVFEIPAEALPDKPELNSPPKNEKNVLPPAVIGTPKTSPAPTVMNSPQFIGPPEPGIASIDGKNPVGGKVSKDTGEEAKDIFIQKKSGLKSMGIFSPFKMGDVKVPSTPPPDISRPDTVNQGKNGPEMPNNLNLPPVTANRPTGGSSPDSHSAATAYRPRSESSEIFRVTVTNVEYVDSIKNHYKPKPGYQFVIVYLSQQNVSGDVQIYSGKFELVDDKNSAYKYIEGLSNYWLVILRPGGINFGYLTFEVPSNINPSELVLHGVGEAPLRVSIK